MNYPSLRILALFGVLSSVVGVAHAETFGPYTYRVESGEVYILDFDETVTGEVVMPETIEGLPVTLIAYAAFQYTQISRVVISDSVRIIRPEVFRNARNLTSVEIGDGVTEIQKRAFYECASLTTITFGNGLTKIGEEAFYSNESLTTIHWGTSPLEIGPEAFGRCLALSSLILPSNVTTIAEEAFAACLSLTSVTLGSGLTSIAGDAFNRSTALSAVLVDPANTRFSSVDGVLFDYNQTELVIYPYGKATTQYTVPEGVTRIGPGAFSVASGSPVPASTLTEVILPTTLESVGERAFYNTEIASVTFQGNSLAVIEDGAFQLCSNLTSVSLPDSVMLIGAFAFTHCRNLSEVDLGEGLESIGFRAFSHTVIRSITLPEGLLSIGERAFWKTRLSAVSIPDSVVSLGAFAFISNSNLTSVVIGDGLRIIPEKAFSSSFVSEITIGRNVETIEPGAFDGVYALQEMIFKGNAPTVALPLTEQPVTVTHFEGATGFDVPPWTEYTITVLSRPATPAEQYEPLIAVVGNDVVITIRRTAVGETYQLQVSPTGMAGSWSNWGSAHTGDDGEHVVTIPDGAVSERCFYQFAGL